MFMLVLISQEPNQANTEVLICGFYSMSEITNMATDLLRNLSILQEYDRFTSALAVLGGGGGGGGIHVRPVGDVPTNKDLAKR